MDEVEKRELGLWLSEKSLGKSWNQPKRRAVVLEIYERRID